MLRELFRRKEIFYSLLISVLINGASILKHLNTYILKDNVSFIVLFYLGKYTVSLNEFFKLFHILKKINVSFNVHFFLINSFSIVVDIICTC